jgi:hypothetical protein
MDTLRSGPGNNVTIAGSGSVMTIGNANSDSLAASALSQANPEIGVLYGGAGNDSVVQPYLGLLAGASGDDTLPET